MKSDGKKGKKRRRKNIMQKTGIKNNKKKMEMI